MYFLIVGKKNQQLSKLRERVLSNPVVQSPHFLCERPRLREGPRVKQLVSNTRESGMPASDLQATEDITTAWTVYGLALKKDTETLTQLALLTFYSFSP